MSSCIGPVCFVPLDPNGPRIFGFSEFLTALALTVIAWTIADVRYRFRIRVSPLPLHGLTFWVIAAVGGLTLLTDLWRAQAWLVPHGNLLTPASWQALLGAVFLLTFLLWVWFAYIRPPTYGKFNAKNYAEALYHVILRGDGQNLAILADELSRSARALIKFATLRDDCSGHPKTSSNAVRLDEDIGKVNAYANDILLLIADRRFCRAMVASSPGTAMAVFGQIARTGKYGVQIGVFARNFIGEALANKDSFLFHETEGYETGLIGYQKPLSHAIFADYRMAEAIGTFYDQPVWETRWDSSQWEVYCRIVLMTLRDYSKLGLPGHSYVLYRALSNIKHAAIDIYKVNGVSNLEYRDDSLAKLRATVNFIRDAIRILDTLPIRSRLKLRLRDQDLAPHHFYDHIADLIFEVIYHAASVKSPADSCWFIQHNVVWSELFNFGKLDGSAGRIIKFKVRRLLYDSIVSIPKLSGFQGASILGFCLNVMGLSVRDAKHDRDSLALHKAMLSWVRKNYATLYSDKPLLAEATLVDGLRYDEASLQLIRTYPADAFSRTPRRQHFRVEPPVPH